MVTPNDVSKFQRVYMKHFGVELEHHVARTKLELLVRQMEIIYQPVEQPITKHVNESYYEQSKPKSETNTELI